MIIKKSQIINDWLIKIFNKIKHIKDDKSFYLELCTFCDQRDFDPSLIELIIWSHANRENLNLINQKTVVIYYTDDCIVWQLTKGYRKSEHDRFWYACEPRYEWYDLEERDVIIEQQ